MKKIIIILLFFLCSCSNSSCNFYECSFDEQEKILIELGYSKKSSERIINLSDEYKKYFIDNYDSDLDRLINIESFKKEYIDDYLETNINIDDFINLYSDKFFIEKNKSEYLKYYNEFSSIRLLVEYVNTMAYKNPYEEFVYSDLTKDNFIIGSKIYFLDKYEPNDLVDVDDGYYVLAKPQLRTEAKNAFIKMADDARSENIYFYISTAYRSFSFQETLYNNYLLTDSKENVDTYSSRPGFSDHQTGLACDIRTKKEAFDDFTNTNECKWLNDNSYKYGFILRYPKDKDNITGYKYESWHYRYVGIDAAKIIHDNNITFDEYYSYYIDK